MADNNTSDRGRARPMIPGERRIVAKRIEGGPLEGQWGVYDRTIASWPVEVPGFGPVPDSFPTEGKADAVAQALEAHYANVPVAP